MPTKTKTPPVPAAVASPFTVGAVLDEYTRPASARTPDAYDGVIKQLMDANKAAVQLTIQSDVLEKSVRGFQRAAHRVDRSASWDTHSEGPAGVVGVLSIGTRKTRTVKPTA